VHERLEQIDTLLTILHALRNALQTTQQRYQQFALVEEKITHNQANTHTNEKKVSERRKRRRDEQAGKSVCGM
jgi:hypothetical protein